MEAALKREGRTRPVPIWELEFHAWDAASGRHVVLGDEMAALTPAEQERAVQENAEIMLGVARDLHFAAITPPGAPGTWPKGRWPTTSCPVTFRRDSSRS